MTFENGKVEKILVIQTAFIGDAILTLPMIQALQKMFPGCEIHVICIPSTEEVFYAAPGIQKIKILNKKDKHKSLFSLKSFAKDLKKENYSRIYSPHRSVRTALLVMFTGIRNTYGFTNSNFKHVYKNLIVYNPQHHEVQRNLDLIGYKYSGNDWKILPQLNISLSDKNKVDEFISIFGIKNEFICVAPGSIWNTKIYPIEYFKEIIKYIIKKFSYYVILVGGKKDETLCREIASKYPEKVYSAAGNFSLVESVELLKRALLLITNDSAPAHLGMCADIPTITLYCSTIPDFGFYPYNEKSSFLSYDDLFCKPCGIHGYQKCPIGTFECGYNLKPGVITEKLKEFVNGELKSS